MPKLVITLTEITRPAPDNPEETITGFETHIEGFYEDMPMEDSVLARLAGPINAAIETVFHCALGSPTYTGQGSIDQVNEEELAQAFTANKFPNEI